MNTSLRGILMVCARAALFAAGAPSEAVAQCPTASATIPASPPDLEVTTACTVRAGNYYFGNVSIHSGGALVFADAKIDFWAKTIIVEDKGAIIEGAPPDDPANPCKDAQKRPIGCTPGAVVTIHLWGAGPANLASRIAGAPCNLKNCGVPDALWIDDPTSKATLPGGVSDYFYKYVPLPFDDGDPNAFYGTKVLGVGYGGTLKLFGRVGSTFCPNGAITCDAIKATDSGTSWRRLSGATEKADGTIRPTGAPQLYLPGHSELLEIQSVGSDSRTIDLKKARRTGTELDGAIDIRAV